MSSSCPAPGRARRRRHPSRTTGGGFVTALSWPARNQRLLRDWLRAHPDDVARYADLKRALAAGGLSADDYTRAKTGLIQELTDRARAERGLPPAPVWEA